MFGLLAQGESGTVGVRDFARSYIDSCGQSIKLGSQEDAAEFLSGLIDRMDEVSKYQQRQAAS